MTVIRFRIDTWRNKNPNNSNSVIVTIYAVYYVTG